jgi:hypothetical protein
MATPLLEDHEYDARADGLDPNIPPLNPEDSLFGLKSAQVEASREVFGRNELIIPETPLWKLFLHQFVGFLVRSSFVLPCLCSSVYYVRISHLFPTIDQRSHSSIDSRSSLKLPPSSAFR